MRSVVLGLLASAMLPSSTLAQAPVFKITPEQSKIDFSFKASVAQEGAFDNWDATLTFPSKDVSTGVLDIKMQPDSVSAGSGMKDGKLKSEDFFNVKDAPYITFYADRVEVALSLRAKRISGPPLVLKQ